MIINPIPSHAILGPLGKVCDSRNIINLSFVHRRCNELLTVIAFNPLLHHLCHTHPILAKKLKPHSGQRWLLTVHRDRNVYTAIIRLYICRVGGLEPIKIPNLNKITF